MPVPVAPGIHIEELPAGVPIVAEPETAVPVFVGYTERADPAGPRRISSLTEFESCYGQGPRCAVREVRIDQAGNFVGADLAANYLLYDSLRLFFANGGGDCYIISVGTYQSVPGVDRDALIAGIELAAGADEPTILLFPDAALLNGTDLGAVQQSALRQCGVLQDRVAVLDTRLIDLEGDDFRERIGVDHLKYGAAYTPWLKVDFSRRVGYAELQGSLRRNGMAVTFRELTADPAVLDLLNELDTAIAAGNQAAMPALELRLAESLAAYRNMLAGLNDLPTPCPPSGAIAGIYAQVDRQRGVWKAPANVSLTGVVGLTANFTAGQLEKLNVDAIAGKSINAIRTLARKGTLVWGARTLAGNDNEWRYISVRRFFNTVEEAIRKSSAWVVFEPNDANTWVRLVGMIENYLNLQWRAGALQGAKPEYAFYVKCGLGATMTGQDILDGSLIVEVGMAAVRPAEFIILKFMHKLQQP